MTEIVSFDNLDSARLAGAADILHRALAHMPSAYDSDAAREEVAKFDGGERVAFAALENGRVTGWIGAIKSYDHAWELHPLVVDPARQHRGVGTALCRHLEDVARARGVLTLTLGTDDDFGGTNLFGVELFPDPLVKLATIAPAKGHPFTFYRKLGWVVTGVVPDANGKGCHDILMAKKL